MIYGVTKLDDGTFLITGSPDTTRYTTLQDAMRAAGRLNAETLDKRQTGQSAQPVFACSRSTRRSTRKRTA